MLSTDPTSFHAQYQALVSSGAIEADPAQADAAEAFAALEERLSSYKPARKLSLLGRLFGDKSEPPPRGSWSITVSFGCAESTSRRATAKPAPCSWPAALSKS